MIENKDDALKAKGEILLNALQGKSNLTGGVDFVNFILSTSKIVGYAKDVDDPNMKNAAIDVLKSGVEALGQTLLNLFSELDGVIDTVSEIGGMAVDYELDANQNKEDADEED